MDTNLRGAYLVSKAVVPQMVARRKGKLVFMASTNSWDGEAQLAHYNASKAGMFLLAKTLAREFGRYGINSNAVGPGVIRTRLSAPIMEDRLFHAKYVSENGSYLLADWVLLTMSLPRHFSWLVKTRPISAECSFLWMAANWPSKILQSHTLDLTRFCQPATTQDPQ